MVSCLIDEMMPFFRWLPLMSISVLLSSGSRSLMRLSFLSARLMSMPRLVPMSFCRLR